MTDLQVTLDFNCYSCDERVSVTVVCQGAGHGHLPIAGVAAVNVPCPMCSEINRVYFEPNGALRDVRPLRQRLALPVPSTN